MVMYSKFQQVAMCSGRRGDGGDEDSDGEGSDNIKALLRIARDALLGVRCRKRENRKEERSAAHDTIDATHISSHLDLCTQLN